MQDYVTAILCFRRCDRILTIVFVRYERVDHIFFQYPDMPTAMLDLLKLAPLYHSIDTGRFQPYDLTDLLDRQHLSGEKENIIALMFHIQFSRY